MKSLNRVQLIGNVGNAPEVKGTGESKVTVMSVATTEKWNDNGGQPQERTTWHRVVVFNGLGANVAKFVKKGSRVFVEGKLRLNEWKDKETGEEKSRLELHASDVIFLDKAPASDEN